MAKNGIILFNIRELELYYSGEVNNGKKNALIAAREKPRRTEHQEGYSGIFAMPAGRAFNLRANHHAFAQRSGKTTSKTGQQYLAFPGSTIVLSTGYAKSFELTRFRAQV